jgi:hypothetical protein
MQPRNRRALEATRSTPHKVKQASKQASKKDQDQYAPEGWATTSGRADRYARNRRRASLSMRMRIMPNANPSASANAMPARPFNWYDGGVGGGGLRRAACLGGQCQCQCQCQLKQRRGGGSSEAEHTTQTLTWHCGSPASTQRSRATGRPWVPFATGSTGQPEPPWDHGTMGTSRRRGPFRCLLHAACASLSKRS